MDVETALVKDIPRILTAVRVGEVRVVRFTSVAAFLEGWAGYLDNGWQVSRTWI